MKKKLFIVIISTILFWSCQPKKVTTIWLDEMDLSQMETGWGTSKAKRSISGNTLTIAGKEFERGVGTHAISKFMVSLNGKGVSFKALVGVDDEANRGTVKFYVLGDKKILWESDKMSNGDSAVVADVDIANVQKLALLVTDAGNGISSDHADWADARFEITADSIVVLSSALVATKPYILTPKAPEMPRINGAKITGASPDKPFMFKVPVTGVRPLTIKAKNLPSGLVIDETTGLITGKVKKEGEYLVSITAKNEKGKDNSELKIVIGEHKMALTPPMGWNSWNSWAIAIDQEKTKAAADNMVKSGLIEHGWTYVNIDDCWEADKRTIDGELLCNDKFPDMEGLASYVHGLGLKIGIYSSPGPTTCQNYPGSWQHELQDAQTWAKWGVDYLKYDWCGYSKVVEDDSLEAYKKPYFVMREALDKVDRDIIYSICQYGMKDVSTWGGEVGGDLWRTTGDIVDNWNSLYDIGFSQDNNAQYAKPGNWNDPDMLIVGYVGWGANLHPSNLSPDEQYTHISLWSLLSAPLLIGCDMARLDDFTLNLLTNDEVLAVNQDVLGKQAAPVLRDNGIEIWAKDLEDGSKAVGIFYTGDVNDMEKMFPWDKVKEGSRKVTVKLSDIGVNGSQTIRDLWRQKDLGDFIDVFETEIPYHGVTLVKIEKK